jgi:hypothetical protein
VRRAKVQQGLATENKIKVLRYKHPSSSMYCLQDEEILQEIQHLQDTIDWKELVPLCALDEVVQTKKAGRANDHFGLRALEYMKLILEKS